MPPFLRHAALTLVACAALPSLAQTATPPAPRPASIPITATPPVPKLKDAFAALYAAVDQYVDKANLHQRFTFTFLKQTIYSHLNGKPYEHITEKFEQMYIGGRPYVRLLERDGKPLSGKDAKKEQQRYEQALNDSSGMSMGQWIKSQGHTPVGHHLPLEDIKLKFATQFVGTDLIDGRTLLRFHLITVSDAMEEPRPVSAQKATVWVDPETKSLARTSYELLADSDELKTGTTGTEDLALVEGSLCEMHSTVHYIIQDSGYGGILDDDTTFSNYKKFTTTIKILPDSETVVP